jgi:RND family efflux transporter MFP subunit
MTHDCEVTGNRIVRTPVAQLGVNLSLVCLAACLGGCSRTAVQAVSSPSAEAATSVGVTKVARKNLARELDVSSELVPFQEIDVYAKESGFIRDLNVDYGSRVKKGQVMAVLEIPELEAQIQQDDAMIHNASDRVTFAENELDRTKAQHHVLHLQFERLAAVSKSKPGLVAQQEVDDAQGKDLASEAAIESSKSSLQSARSELLVAQARKQHDTVLMSYANITAPFAGVVTQRFANLGTLMQAGTNSSTQAMPLVRLSQDDLFRLVIPVPESYVRYVHVGDPVKVRVPSMNRDFPGRVTRFSVDVMKETRTMHTEVDVPNTDRALIPGVYAEASIQLDRKPNALYIPLQAVRRQGDETAVFVVDSSNKLEERKIRLGLQTATDAEVLSGLSEGDQVVVSDRSGLKPGEFVRPQIVELIEYQGQKE